ncbi:hypothetical protein HDU86_005878 [Geranomyces michiganensis]|nr:hypothetical protein HDU86_005878 [Geranomyces michiganensis]
MQDHTDAIDYNVDPWQQIQSPWVAYAGLVLATTAAFLLPTLLGDLLVFLWKWCGLSGPEDDAEEEEAIMGNNNIIAPGSQVTGTSSSDMERRFAELQQQLCEAQRRIGYLESSSMTQAPASGPPPPPPPAPPIMNTDTSLKIVQSDSKRRAVQPEVAQTSMGAVLQELFNVQKKVVDIISPRKEFYSPRTKYLNKSKMSKPPVDSPLRRNLAAEWAPQPSKLSQIETASPPSKALENIKNVKAAMNAAYNRKPSPESAVHNPGAVPKGLTPAVANAVEVAVAKELPVTPVKKDENGLERQSVEAKDPMAEGDLSKVMSRLRPTNIPRSPGGTTLIPQRKGSRKTLHESDCMLFLQDVSLVLWDALLIFLGDSTVAQLKEKFKTSYTSSSEAESTSAKEATPFI